MASTCRPEGSWPTENSRSHQRASSAFAHASHASGAVSRAGGGASCVLSVPDADALVEVPGASLQRPSCAT
ncbi:Uncharacterised protein [Mycobacteroides abscessus]|nr:Uncharacterised protein [Mycobacteroides abscessus]